MMKRTLIFILMIMISCPLSYGQEFVPAQVNLSKEKVRFANGDIMYVHTVLKGQTFFSIATAYGYKPQELKEYNPSINIDNIKPGDIIYIPVEKTPSESEKSSSRQKEENKKTYTTFPDSRKSGNNADKKDNRSEISKQDEEYSNNFRASDKNYVLHKVKWYEDIYDIADKYGTSVEAIVHLNNLQSVKLKKNTVILIPDKDYVISNKFEIKDNGKPVQETETSSSASQDIVIPEQDKQEQSSSEIRDTHEKNSFFPASGRSREYTVSVILPLNTAYGTAGANSNFMDFYSGVLMAADSLKNEGMKLRLNIIDLSEYGNSTSSAINSGILDGSSIIIGPATKKSLSEMVQYSTANAIPVISPVDNSAATLAHNNPYFIQAVPSEYAINREITEEFMSGAGNDNLLVIYEKGYENSSTVKNTLYRLNEKGIRYNMVSYDIHEGRRILPTILSKLTRGNASSQDYPTGNVGISVNRVLVASENQAFVSDAIRNLDLATIRGYRIHLYGQSNWKNFESVDINLYHKMNLRLVVAYNVDYSNSSTDRFVKNYRALFNAEPTPYSFQGYDIALYMMGMLYQYGPEFIQMLEREETAMIQSNLRFVRCHDFCGYINHAPKRIIYNPDYSVSEY